MLVIKHTQISNRYYLAVLIVEDKRWVTTNQVEITKDIAIALEKGTPIQIVPYTS